MQINLSDETLDHLIHALGVAAKYYTDRAKKAKLPTARTRIAEQLGHVRDLQAIFADPEPPAPARPDIEVVGEGSVFRFVVESKDALDYVKTNVQVEPWQWLGGRTFAVDHRLAPDLCYHLREAGWTVVVR